MRCAAAKTVARCHNTCDHGSWLASEAFALLRCTTQSYFKKSFCAMQQSKFSFYKRDKCAMHGRSMEGSRRLIHEAAEALRLPPKLSCRTRRSQDRRAPARAIMARKWLRANTCNNGTTMASRRVKRIPKRKQSAPCSLEFLFKPRILKSAALRRTCTADSAIFTSIA